MINHKTNDQRLSSILSSLDFWISDEKIIIDDKYKIQNVDRNVVCAK
ncbi:MAG: hypothetical protein ABI550_02895 [Ignavibacteriaceae bacterium]